MIDDDHGIKRNPRVGRAGTVFRGTQVQAFLHPRSLLLDLRLPERVRAGRPRERVDIFLDLDMAFGGRGNMMTFLCGTGAHSWAESEYSCTSGHA